MCRLENISSFTEVKGHTLRVRHYVDGVLWEGATASWYLNANVSVFFNSFETYIA